jgi:phosphopantothenoylcysteine decarboxylase / phosphopantothenate---cysteine ligase
MALGKKKIILGITGGIAAYKAPFIVRGLKAQGAEVRVVMTASAKEFVTSTTLQAVSGHPVHDSLFDPAQEAAMGHIALARWADAILIAPASAQCLARLAHGLADDLLSTICLATQAPILLAPAMNRLMWENPATQANINLLSHRNFQVLPVGVGEQACGEVGAGRMLEPELLVNQVVNALTPPQFLAGKYILITAGPTHEYLDPVRFLSNPSSGKMGYALAEQAARHGARVTLISGPTQLHAAPAVNVIEVTSALDMYDAVMTHIHGQDIFIASAAVSDYRPATSAPHKIKKSGEAITLDLLPNPDILKSVAQLPQRPFCVGFAAETQDHAEQALNKLKNKQLDLICVNDVANAEIGFASDDNALSVFSENNQWTFEQQPKVLLAQALLRLIANACHKESEHALSH